MSRAKTARDVVGALRLSGLPEFAEDNVMGEIRLPVQASAASQAGLADDASQVGTQRRTRGRGRAQPNDPAEVLRQELLAADEDIRQIHTPYGPLFRSFEIPSRTEGESLNVTYVCPFAFLFYACEFAPPFAAFLEACIGRRGLANREMPGSSTDQPLPADAPKASVVFYYDEVTPGNNLRPDKGRQYLAVYWTFLEFPAWFRASQNGWFTMCYVPVETLAKMPAEHSQLGTCLLSAFFPEDALAFSFARTGMRVPIRSAALPAARAPAKSNAPRAGGGPSQITRATPAVRPRQLQTKRKREAPAASSAASPAAPGAPSVNRFVSRPHAKSAASLARGTPLRWFFFLATFACFLGDEKAIKQFTMAKGAGGRKPCINCQNVVSHLPPNMRPEDLPPDGPLVHIICADPTKFIPHTLDTLQRLHAYLTEASLHRSIATDLRDAGISVSPHGLLASPMAKISNVPDCIFWDWMHCMVASGGIAQYELNQLLRRLRARLPLEKLDVFASQYIVFEKRHKLKARFAERVVDSDGAHIRAFASEVLAMVTVVGVFLEVLRLPDDFLVREVQCFRLLHRIFDLLRLGDAVHGKLGLLRTLVAEHHRLAVSVYPEVIRPKAHYMFHVCDCIARFGVLLSCFVTERKHRESKRIAAHAFRSWCTTMLKRTVAEHFQWLSVIDNLQPCKLLRPWNKALPLPWHLKLVQARLVHRDEAVEPAEIRMGRELQTPNGLLACNDLLAFYYPLPRPRQVRVGFAKRFFKVRQHFFVFLEELRHDAGLTFHSGLADRTAVFVDAAILHGSFPYMTHGNKVAVLASADTLG